MGTRSKECGTGGRMCLSDSFLGKLMCQETVIFNYPNGPLHIPEGFFSENHF